VTGISSNYESAVGTVGSDLAGEFGSLTISANGDWTYEPNDVVDNDPAAQDVFTYTITDADGDTSEATITINLSDTKAPVAGTGTAAVDDDGLSGGNAASTAGDLDADQGDAAAAVPDESVFIGSLSGFDLGGDVPVTIDLSSNVGDTLGSEAITYAWAGNTLTASSAARGAVFKVDFETDGSGATGQYTVTLLQNVLHVDDDANDENDASVTLAIKVTDSDGSFDDTGSLAITFDDDTPVAADIEEDGNVEAYVTNLSFIVDISSSMSDNDLTLTESAIATLIQEYELFGAVNLNIVQFYENNTILSEWISSDGFTVSGYLDRDQSGTDIERGLSGMVGEYDDAPMTANKDVMYFFGDGNTYDDYEVDFIAYLPTWLDFLNSGAVDSFFAYSVNTSSVLSDISALSNSNTAATPVNIDDVGDLAEAVSGTVSTQLTGNLFTEGSNLSVSYGADDGYIDSITIGSQSTNYDANNATQQINLSGVAALAGNTLSVNFLTGDYTYTVVNQLAPSFELEIGLIDGDGDSASYDYELTISSTSAPIVLDLENDGVDYMSRDSGVVFTDEATSQSVSTAWVGQDDGLLVIDADKSGTVNESKEYVFTEWSDTAETDMEAVAEVFDTNQDGVLDANDERFDEFAVWQDADSDGVTDAGELTSLIEMGVESIALDYTADSVPGNAADGDVTIHGQSAVTWSDGSTTIAEDTSFATEALDLRDLLSNDVAGDDVSSYLNVVFDGTATVIEVSNAGQFTSGDSSGGIVDQTITLEGVDLVGSDDLATTIQNMLNNGQLNSD